MRLSFRRGLLRPTLTVCGISLALLLGACESVRDQLGLTKSSPDEFAVVINTPLSLPPDYKLRPPDPGAPRPQEISVQERVKAALFDATPSPGDGVGGAATAGESALLAAAGTTEQDAGIRAVINRDNAIFAEDSGGFIDALIFWRDPSLSGTVIDAAGEDQRLQEAEATGAAPSAGDTVIIKRRDEGILEGLF
jgi:hypothetical protein